MGLGAFDTLSYHEDKLKLPSSHGSATKLLFHALRDFLYALIIGSLAWFTWLGPLAYVLLISLAAAKAISR